MAPIQASPEGTYGTKTRRWVRKLIDSLARRQIDSYRRAGGTGTYGPRRVKWLNRPLVLLITKGARSGLERTVAINGFADGDDAWLVVASNGGSAHHPAWFKNMIQHPDDVWLQVGARKVRVRGESLTGAERDEAYGRIANTITLYAGYPKKTDREIPVVRLTRVAG